MLPSFLCSNPPSVSKSPIEGFLRRKNSAELLVRTREARDQPPDLSHSPCTSVLYLEPVVLSQACQRSCFSDCQTSSYSKLVQPMGLSGSLRDHPILRSAAWGRQAGSGLELRDSLGCRRALQPRSPSSLQWSLRCCGCQSFSRSCP